jgi:hypothetical protein
VTGFFIEVIVFSMLIFYVNHGKSSDVSGKVSPTMRNPPDPLPRHLEGGIVPV